MATVPWPFLGGLSSTLGGLTSFGLAGLLTSLTITLRGPPLPSELFVSSFVTSLIVTLGGLISLMTDLRGFTSIVTRLGSSTSMATIALDWKKSSKSCRCHRSRSTSTHSSPSNTLARIRMFLNFLNWNNGSIRVALDKCQRRRHHPTPAGLATQLSWKPVDALCRRRGKAFASNPVQPATLPTWGLALPLCSSAGP